MGYVHTLHRVNAVLPVEGDDRNRFQHVIKSERSCVRACESMHRPVRHVASTLRSRNETSAAAAANRAEQREGVGGRELEGGKDGRKKGGRASGGDGGRKAFMIKTARSQCDKLGDDTSHSTTKGENIGWGPFTEKLMRSSLKELSL